MQDGVLLTHVYSGSLSWDFVAPPGTTDIQAPSLPAALSALEPTGAPDVTLVVSVETTEIADYAEFRSGKGLTVISDPLASDGSVRRHSVGIFPPQ